ncbi:IS3 family transposase [Desulfotomaculum defluvii]
MSKIIFSSDDIKKLETNPYVAKVSERSITYTNDFKRLFIDQYLKGKLPRAIFTDAGFDIDIIGVKRYEQAAYRWIRSYNEDGILGLRDTRTENSGRPRINELSQEEIITRQEAKIKLLEEQIELLKKLDKIERRMVNTGKSLATSDIFQLINDTISKYKMKGMVSYFCDMLGVSRSGYYNYLSSEETRQLQEEKDLHARDMILNAYYKHGYKKGSRSIKMVLEQEFELVFNRKRIQRIMRKYDIKCPIRKANPYRRMAKATKEHRVVPNLLNRQFKQRIPGKVLLTDITYLPFGVSKMAYLSTIKDASTNEILSYHVSERITLDIATKTIENLINHNSELLHSEAFVHSDQGCHYTSPTFQRLLKKYGLGQSMSRRGNCWDNAPQESFFGHMKDEIDYRTCNTFQEVEKLIDHYINYYNNHRYQWGLKKLAPVQYRNQLLAA